MYAEDALKFIPNPHTRHIHPHLRHQDRSRSPRNHHHPRRNDSHQNNHTFAQTGTSSFSIPLLGVTHFQQRLSFFDHENKTVFTLPRILDENNPLYFQTFDFEKPVF